MMLMPKFHLKKPLLLTIFVNFVFLTNFVEAVEITNPLKAKDFPTLITSITGIFSGIVGSLAVLMLVIAGIYFVTAAGNPEQISKAKKFVTYAIIGVIITLLASAVVSVIESL